MPIPVPYSIFFLQALRISSQAMSESSAGLVVNLMANDVNRFDNGLIFMHYLWIGPVETVVITFLNVSYGRTLFNACLCLINDIDIPVRYYDFLKCKGNVLEILVEGPIKAALL